MASWSRAAVALLSVGVPLAFGTMGGCRGNAFTSSPDAGGGGQAGQAHGEGGLSDGAGAAAPQGGAAGGESAVGGGGEGAASAICETKADCAEGSFCRDGACVSCRDFSDLSTLRYDNPQPLSRINATSGVSALRFARPSGAGDGLVYARDFFGGRLWFTSNPAQSAGTPLPSPEGVFETAGLRIDFPLPEPLDAHNFFFQRREALDGSLTRLFGATMDDDGVVTDAIELPSPLNTDGVSSFSLALSQRRAIWTQNLDAKLNIRLKMVRLPPDGAEPTELRLPLPFDCGFATEFEYAPWLVPDGSVLFFAARAYDESCTVTDQTPTRVHVLALSELGEPVGPARALEGLGSPERRQTDPALSDDGCHLFFSGAHDTGMGLFTAERAY